MSRSYGASAIRCCGVKKWLSYRNEANPQDWPVAQSAPVVGRRTRKQLGVNEMNANSLLMVTSLCLLQSGLVTARGESKSERPPQQASSFSELTVSGRQHCLLVDKGGKPKRVAASFELKPYHRYVIRVSGEARIASGDALSLHCMFPDDENGQRLRQRAVRSGESFTFTTADYSDSFYGFVLNHSAAGKVQGEFLLRIESCPLVHFDSGRLSSKAGRLLNINFGRAPMGATCGSVLGGDYDYWNLVDHGELNRDRLRWGDGSISDVSISVSPNDGEWGIAGHTGVYHAYICHNARNVDVSVTINNLPAGKYNAYVMAHGDSPDQNASVEILSEDNVYSGESTVGDGSADYRSHELTPGCQYVQYKIQVVADQPVVITSRRAASSLAMLNAIQLYRIKPGK